MYSTISYGSARIYICCMNIFLKNENGIDERLRVFILDDCKIIREKIKEHLLLKNDVVIVGEAESKKDGMELIAEFNPDVVFLDIKLRDENGLSVLIDLKRTRPMIKVVMFSNSADPYYKRKFRECGCDYFLDKSKDFSMISGVIDEIVLLRTKSI